MRTLNAVAILSLAFLSNSMALTGDAILKKVDANFASHTKVVVTKMIVHARRSTRTIEAKSYIQGTEKSFTEYLSPPREKGTKMLKLGDQLWIYSPSS